MHESESAGQRVLAQFREGERPPPSVDDLVLKRLRRERRAIVAAQVQRRRSLTRAAIVVSAAAVVVLFLAVTARVDISDYLGVQALRALASPDQVEASRLGRAEPPEVNNEQSPEVHDERPPSTNQLAEGASPDPGFVLLRDARELLKSGKHLEALELLGRCRAVVGSDDLAEECDMLEVQSYCAAGRRDAGVAKLAAFKKHWPNSQYERGLRRACR